MKEIIQTKKDKIYDLIALLPDSSEKNKMHIINTITQVPLQIDKYHPCSGIYNPISYKEGKVCIRRTDYKSNPCIYCDSQDKEFTNQWQKKKIDF